MKCSLCLAGVISSVVVVVVVVGLVGFTKRETERDREKKYVSLLPAQDR